MGVAQTLFKFFFFFHKIVLSMRVIIAEGQIAASKAGLQALLPSFPPQVFAWLSSP